MKLGIVTDSTADIPPDLAEDKQLCVIPNRIVIDGQTYEDGRDISRDEFYTRLPQMAELPVTGTASSGAYQEVYTRLFEQGADAVLSIHTSAQLSGILNAATAAARDFGERVRVLDSEFTSMGLGFQVLAAAEAAARRIPVDEVIQILADLRRRIRVMAMFDTLEYVRRSGRVSWARARLGNLLQVKPFVEIRDGGKVASLGEARTRSKGIARLKKLLLDLGRLEKLAVLHTNALEEARQFLTDVNPDLPTEPLMINITTVIGAHTGPKALGFAAVLR